MAGKVDIHYCKQTETPSELNRLVPAPVLSFNPQLYYANDTIIGYSYSVSINGYAVAKESDNDFLEGCLDQIEYIRSIFNVNGGNLYVVSKDGANVIVAKGATIRSIDISESPNYALNYVPYSISIDFNEVDFVGCNDNAPIGCSTSLFHFNQTINSITSDNLVDIKKHKIQEFSDGWNFTVDQEIYKQYAGIGNDDNVFSVQYQIQATGRTYYVDDKLVPAWHQAREFVQDRLYKQVKGLMQGVGRIEDNNMDACGSTKNANQLFDIVKGDGVLDKFKTPSEEMPPNVDVYNETISVQCSESDGTFTATYNAIVKRGTSNNPANNMARHTFSTSRNVNNSNGEITASIEVKGEVEGLLRGGFVYYNSQFSLPQNGTFLVNQETTDSKYQNARAYYYDKIGTDYDVYDYMKNLGGVNRNSLYAEFSSGGAISPESFSIDHDYIGGKISYSASYTTLHTINVDSGYQNITITRKNPAKMYQEFSIPGRNAGPIVQDLYMYSPATVSINIEGIYIDPSCGTSNLCTFQPPIPANLAISDDSSQYVVSSKSYNTNLIDGSYSINYELTLVGS